MTTHEQLTFIANSLQEAIAFEGPYRMKINDVEGIISREQFLEFYVEWAVDQIEQIKEAQGR